MAFNLENSAVNTGLLNSIFDLSKAQKAVSAAIFGLTDKLNIVNTDDYKKSKGLDEDSKATIENMTDAVAALKATLDEQKEQSESDLTHITNIRDIISSLSDPDNVDNMGKGVDHFVRLLDRLDALKIDTDKVDAISNFINKTTDIPSSINDVGTGLVSVGAGIGAMSVGLWMMSNLVTIPAALGGLAVITGMVAIGALMSKLNTDKVYDGSAALGHMSLALIGSAVALAIISVIPAESIVKSIGVIALLGVTMVGLELMLSKLKTSNTSDSTQVSWAPLVIAASIGVLGVSIWAFSELVTDSSMILRPVLTIVALGGAFALLNKLVGTKEGGIEGVGKGLLYTAASIGVLALSIKVWDILEPDSIVTPILAITGLGLGLALLSVIGSENIKSTAWSLVIAAGSIAVLAIALKVWDILEPDNILVPLLAVTGLALALGVMSKLGAGKLLMASAALAIGAASFAILAWGISKFNDLDSDTVVEAGLFMTGLGVAIGLLGMLGAPALIGAGSLLLGAGAIFIAGLGLEKFNNLSTDKLIEAGLFMTGLGTVVTLLGLLPTGLLGAAVLAAAGGAVYAIGVGVAKFDTDDIPKLDALGEGIVNFSKHFVKLGNPITALKIGLGATAALALSANALMLSKSIVNISNSGLSDTQIIHSGNSLGLYMTTLTDVIDDKSKDFDRVENGIDAMMGLGKLVSNLSDGVVKMGNLQFVEYEVKNGKLVPKRVRQYTERDFERVGYGVGTVINALAGPLAAIGAGEPTIGVGSFKIANPFLGNAVEEGVEALSGVGSLIKNVADFVVDIGSLQFTEYAIRNGKMVAVSTRKYTEKDFTNVGSSIGNIITALTSPLAAIGKDDGVFSDSDVENGIDALKNLGNHVLNPIANIVKVFNAAGLDNQKASAFKTTLNTIATISSELSGTKLKRLSEFKDTLDAIASDKLYKAMEKLHKLMDDKLVPIFATMNDTMTKMNDMYVTVSNANLPKLSPAAQQNAQYVNDQTSKVKMKEAIANDIDYDKLEAIFGEQQAMLISMLKQITLRVEIA